LSMDEEKALSDYFQQKKQGSKRAVISKRTKLGKRKLETA